MNKYYIYTHSFNGNIFYVGKGSGNRAFSTKNRSKSWNSFVKDIDGNFKIEIVKYNLSEDEAYALESQLIAENPHVLNIAKDSSKIDYDNIDFKSYFYYDETSPSCLRFKKNNNAINPKHKRFVGDVAGYCKFYANGKPQEWTIRIGSVSYRGHIVVLLINDIIIEKDKVINHVDNNPHNNCLSNLEVCTQSENMLKTSRHTAFSDNFMLVERSRKTVQNGKEYEHFSVRCRYTENGIRKSKSFSYLIYGGKEAAWTTARQFRDLVLKELYRVKPSA